MDIKQFIQVLPIKTFVEVGCHFGIDTEDFRKMHPLARIVCFEPDPRNLKNLHERKITEIAEVYPYALSNTNGTSTFYQSGGICPDPNLVNRFGDWSLSGSLKVPTGHITQHPWCKFEKKTNVQTIRLDDFEPLQNVPIDFMWVDVQGAEDIVFSGAKETLLRTHYVYTEYCNTELYKDQLNLPKILELFGYNWNVIHDFGGDVLLENTKFSI